MTTDSSETAVMYSKKNMQLGFHIGVTLKHN